MNHIDSYSNPINKYATTQKIVGTNLTMHISRNILEYTYSLKVNDALTVSFSKLIVITSTKKFFFIFPNLLDSTAITIQIRSRHFAQKHEFLKSRPKSFVES